MHSSGLGIHAVCPNLVIAPVITATPDRIAPLIARIALFNALPAPLHPSVDRVATPLPVFTVVGDTDSAPSCTVQLVAAPCSTVLRYQCVPQARASTSFARTLIAAPVIAATQSRTTHTQLQIQAATLAARSSQILSLALTQVRGIAESTRSKTKLIPGEPEHLQTNLYS